MRTFLQLTKPARLFLLIFFCVSFSGLTVAQNKNYTFGTELGILSGTIDNSVFEIGFNGGYLFTPTFSFGEYITFTPGGNLFQISANSVARFHVPAADLMFIPYMGIGFVYGSFEVPPISENDFAISFPIGLMVTYPVGPQIQISARPEISIYTLDYGALGMDKIGFKFMVGFMFSP